MPDPETGGTKVSVVQPLAGGSGGRPMKDGLDGVDVAMQLLDQIHGLRGRLGLLMQAIRRQDEEIQRRILALIDEE